MFTIYANDADEKNTKSKKPEDYRVKDPVVKAIFEAGCGLVKEESEKRMTSFVARRKRFDAIHPKLRDVRICQQRGE